MITIKESGKIYIPQEDGFIGYAGDNLNKTIEFIVLNRADENLVYRLYLEFDDSTVNFFILDKKIQDNDTVLTWRVANEHIYKDGIVNIQIKAFNTSGEIFHSDTAPLFVGKSIELCNYLSERSVTEFKEVEENLNKLYADVENAKEFLPYIGDNGNWFVYDYASKAYADSGFIASATVNGYSVLGEINSSADESCIPTVKAVYNYTGGLSNDLSTKIGNLAYLVTEDKTSLVNAVNELNSDVSNKLDNAESVIETRLIADGAVSFEKIASGLIYSNVYDDSVVHTNTGGSESIPTVRAVYNALLGKLEIKYLGLVVTLSELTACADENKLYYFIPDSGLGFGKEAACIMFYIGNTYYVTNLRENRSFMLTASGAKTEFQIDTSQLKDGSITYDKISENAKNTLVEAVYEKIADGTEVSY